MLETAAEGCKKKCVIFSSMKQASKNNLLTLHRKCKPMNIRAYIYIICMVWSMAAMAQPQFTPKRNVANVGEIMFQVPRKVVFEYANTGDSDLLLTGVHPSCGCTSVTYSDRPLAAGETAEIVATYDAAMLGVFYKELEVTTNASDQPVYLTFQGKVTTQPTIVGEDFPVDLDNVRMTTNVIEFDNVNKGDRPVAELQIINATRQAYQPQLMHLPPYLTAEYIPKVLAGGRVGRVLITLDSNDLPAMGLTQTSIYLARYNGDKIGSDNEISVSAILLPDLRSQTGVGAQGTPRMSVSAESVNMGAWGKKSALTGTIVIANNGTADLEVSRLQALNRAVEISLNKRVIRPGEKARMKVKVQKKYVGRDKSRMAVLLITNDRNCPKKIFPVAID